MFGIKNGNGYDGYSMSNNARAAYEDGEMPLSKWTKEAICVRIDVVLAENFLPEEIGFTLELLKSLPASALKDLVLRRCGWHHTSDRYNRTDFYDVSVAALEHLTDAEIVEAKEKKRESAQKPAPKIRRGSIIYLVWSGTRKHPKATRQRLDGVLIEERGAFYIVTDDNGREILRKKIGSNGTEVRY